MLDSFLAPEITDEDRPRGQLIGADDQGDGRSASIGVFELGLHALAVERAIGFDTCPTQFGAQRKGRNLSSVGCRGCSWGCVDGWFVDPGFGG